MGSASGLTRRCERALRVPGVGGAAREAAAMVGGGREGKDGSLGSGGDKKWCPTSFPSPVLFLFLFLFSSLFLLISFPLIIHLCH